MRELDDETGIGLIEKRRQGFGKVNVIYVKTFMPEKTNEKKIGEELWILGLQDRGRNNMILQSI